MFQLEYKFVLIRETKVCVFVYVPLIVSYTK